MLPPRFKKDDRIQYRSDRSKVGAILKDAVEAQGVWWYRVKLAGGVVETTPESDLEPFQARQDAEALFIEGRFGGPEDLIRRVTFHKLGQPLENTLYSLGASRTEFFAHQYKPLLKFIDSDDQRLLIADEVGLGKTIEAGLIMVELRARRQLQSAMVVCPSALTAKWRDEMWRRFDEEYDILSSKDLRELLTKFQKYGELPELRAIVSLQSLRQKNNRELLEALALPIDLMIVDEAHHLRNPDTQSHRAVEALAVGALAIVFLTATPIHLGGENLFHLLRLLQPGEFDDLVAFHERLAANAPVVEAERLARKRPVPKAEIRQRLESLSIGPSGDFFRDSPFLGRSLQLLVPDGEMAVPDQVALTAELKDLNLLSHIVTRSRKREVFEKVAVRTPQVVDPEPTNTELAFYRAVTDFVRDLHGGLHETAGMFAAITAQRQVASCMQAAKTHFAEMALTAQGRPEESDLDFDTWDEESDEEDAALPLPQRVLLAAAQLGETDTKFDALAEKLGALEAEEAGRKVVVFSYFKGTLRYLERRLKERRVSCVRIDGDVTTDPRDPEKDERGRLIQKFRDDPTVQVLLSSEVGSEGLDFQFAHILVNYDLPWNPMRVEQRIGRLDRIGQGSDRIIIINLSLPGTIEHRILERLYERIGIFRHTLGDLEAILGGEVERLTRDLLSSRLTPEEEEQRIEETAQALEKKLQDLARLEQDGDRLVGAGAYFDEQLERARSGGETLAGKDLEIFLREFLRRRFPESELQTSPGGPLLVVDDELFGALRALQDGRPLWLRLLRRILTERGRVPVTFHSSEAFKFPDKEFLAPHHPIFRLAVQHYDENPEELHPVAAVRVRELDGISQGAIAFGVYQVAVSLGSGRGRHRLEPVFVSLDGNQALDRHRSSLLFGKMLREGARAELAVWERGAAEQLAERIDLLAIERFNEDRRVFMERQAARVKTRLVSLQSSFERKAARKQELLEGASAAKKDPRYIRLLQATLDGLRADYETRRREIEKETEVGTQFTLVAAGLVNVEA